LYFAFCIFTHGYLKSSPTECIFYRDKINKGFIIIIIIIIIDMIGQASPVQKPITPV